MNNNNKSLIEHWLILYRRRWLILSITVAAILTALFFSKILPPVYMAKATFFVPKIPDVVTYHSSEPGESLARAPLIPLHSEEIHAPFIGILKSRLIAELVQKEFPHKKVGDLEKRDVDFLLSNEYMIEVYVRDRNPEFAAAIANAYVKHLDNIINSFSLPSKKNDIHMIEKMMLENERKLTKTKRELRAFQEKNRTTDLNEEIKQLISQKTDFQMNLQSARVEQQVNETNVMALKEKVEAEADIYKSSNFVLTSPLLDKLKKDITDVETQIASIKAEFSEAHPERVNLRNQYVQIEKNINLEIERIVNSQIQDPDIFYEDLRRQLVNLLVEKPKIHARIQANMSVLADIEIRMKEIPELSIQLDTLYTNIDRYKSLMEKLEVNFDEVKMQGERDIQVAVLLDAATPPEKPSFPIMWLNGLIAGLSGLLAGIVFSYFVDYLGQTKRIRMIKILKAIEKSKKV